MALRVSNSGSRSGESGSSPSPGRLSEARPARAGGLSYRIANRGQPAPASEEAPEDRTPVMVRLGAADLATVDTLITAGIVTSRAEGLRWSLSRLREHPAYARLQQQAGENDDSATP